MKITFRQYADGLINEKQKFIDDLADLTLSTKQTVYRWMSGESVPPRNKREIIANYLGKTTAELWPTKSDDDE